MEWRGSRLSSAVCRSHVLEVKVGYIDLNGLQWLKPLASGWLRVRSRVAPPAWSFPLFRGQRNNIDWRYFATT